jgi:predicted O-methyltransferase YrrM
MRKELSLKIHSYTQQEAQLLSTGKFGTGLWPVDEEIGQYMFDMIVKEGLIYGVEVGAGVGFSTFWLAEAFRENRGFLLSFEYFLPKVEQWEMHMRQFFGKNYQGFVDIVPSEVTRWIAHAGRKKLDFLFFDQRKRDYLPHLKQFLPLLKKGALICVDNVLSHPKPCAEYLDFVRTDQRFESTLFSQGAGLEVSRFLGS